MDENNDKPKEVIERPENSERKVKIKYSRVKRKVLRHVWPIRILAILAVVLITGLIGFGIYKFFSNLGIGNIFSLAYDFVTKPTDRLVSNGERVNILVMGKAGGSRNEDSPDLTDTMMLVSIGLSKPDVVIVSIPRDLWIPEIRAKINAAYYWGSKNTPYFISVGGGHPGITFAKMITGEVTGQPIAYGVVIDFSGFKDVIDALGGIKVDVATSFTDHLFPVPGKENDNCGGDPTFACRYQTVSFNAGPQLMNGDTALIFVRSRHAEGVEGGDQAREARQQKVIDAVKDRLMQPSTFLSIKTDLALLNIAEKYVETDMDNTTMAILARVVLGDYKTIHQYLIPADLLTAPAVSAKYDLQEVFIPAAGSGNWKDIVGFVSGVLN